MKHLLKLRLCLFGALFFLLPATAGDTIGPALRAALQTGEATALEVIVTFHGEGAPTGAQADLLRNLGLNGVLLHALPVAGVVASPAAIDALADHAEVRSLRLNAPLVYDNDYATQLTGVDRLRADTALHPYNNGLPFSGRGVGVLVNDSGVDGLHPDIAFPDHLKANVAAQINLRAYTDLAPFTGVSGVANSDIGGGHGTHVAGIIGGNGAQSSGLYEGVAPGADLLGYGSGAALFILDTLGAFDWALVHQYDYGIRVISNSFGNTGDVGTAFDPDDPTNVATKACTDRGMVVVFSAGNSGSGQDTITGNFKKAPWVITVAAGDSQGNLADFSSRGVDGRGGEVVVDGTTYTWEDRPTVTAPGVAIVSTRASAGVLGPLSAQDDLALDPAHLPYYTHLDGTSMACPHVSGIVALMLEANPSLNAYQIKDLLQNTATNMPGYAAWEAGAGYVNAYAAVVAALELRTEYGATLNLDADFHSHARFSQTEASFSLRFDPLGLDTVTHTFQVGADVSRLEATAAAEGLLGSGNLVGLQVTAPDGTTYTSGIPVAFALSLSRGVAVDDPQPGTWTAELYGLQGLALPETAAGTLFFQVEDGYDGLDDVAGHAAATVIKTAVARRLVDGHNDQRFRPNWYLRRDDLAIYLTMGAGIRQALPLEGGSGFDDVDAALAPFAAAVTATGAALKNVAQDQAGVMTPINGDFAPNARVSRQDLAYALIQSLGLEAEAQAFTGPVRAESFGRVVTLEDDAAISATRKGYVQLALDLGILRATFALTQGPFDLEPTLTATFAPADPVTRAGYADAAVRFFGVYR